MLMMMMTTTMTMMMMIFHACDIVCAVRAVRSAEAH